MPASLQVNHTAESGKGVERKDFAHLSEAEEWIKSAQQDQTISSIILVLRREYVRRVAGAVPFEVVG